jgi:hypothetical protein
VSGRDANPAGWGGCSGLKDIAGIAMSDTTSGLKLPGCSVGKNCIDGNPKFVQDPIYADTTTYFVYGNSTYQALAATATLTYASGTLLTGVGPVVAGGICQTADNQNWGDPSRVLPAGGCESYFPIIHAFGDLKISGNGKGQGILLVDGDLDMTGGFTFVGVIIVRGTFATYGAGAKITGGVMAANVSLDEDNTVLGNSSIQYSSCAIATVMNGSAFPKAIKQRGWVDVL